jgi:hypothetical protein
MSYRQVDGDSWINVPSWVPRKQTPCLYPRHKKDQPAPLLSRGLGPRPSSDSKPPTLQAGLSMVLRPPQPNIYLTTLKAGLERVRTHNKRETSLPAPISKYMLGTSRSVTWLWNPMQRPVLNRHRRNKCNQSPALLPNQVQVHPTHSAQSPIIHIYLYSMW